MPDMIEIIRAALVNYKTASNGLDDKKYIAFAYPGKFAGLGDEMVDALQMAKMRYRSVKKKFFETRDDATENDWAKFTRDRQTKIELVYETKGISDASVWSEENVDKTKKGNS